MRMHIELDDALVAQVDQLAGPRGRSAFVRSAIEEALRAHLRWADLEAAAGAIDDAGHAWDADPGSWVRDQCQADVHHAG
jgi:Arc/MetJ family transcription regulator